MTKYIRYALASVCFAASVACLALWWRSYSHADTLRMRNQETFWRAESIRGYVTVGGWTSYRTSPVDFYSATRAWAPDFLWEVEHAVRQTGSHFGKFSVVALRENWYCPHWYPALIFTLAGVGVIRFRRQFSIRSALIAFAVVAALLAMPLML
ncbi:hypothetical protein [Lacipirellula limnantheis]|uniref:Glycosyltransferase RgtA/B/C/D-like domain-containing protein n=1 Tax=Lacipirellula limnantheis TaxID=2528024 RepID=A0A517U080_9BACT|nr:hypothetical protein [Lacipirellula limnantheis]QDT74032.1 hypothetical protein I41_32260 [Lacipirellula limnantheis]